MPLHHTTDPSVRAGDAADHASKEIWKKTGNAKLSDEIGAEVYSGIMRETISDEFPPCPNEECETFGSSGRVVYGAWGGYCCYECCSTFTK